jgi:hypothetical protein
MSSTDQRSIDEGAGEFVPGGEVAADANSDRWTSRLRIVVVLAGVVVLADLFGFPTSLYAIDEGTVRGFAVLAVGILAVLAIATRGSLRIGTALAIAEVVRFGASSPTLSNHAIVMWIVATGCTIAIVIAALKRADAARTGPVILSVGAAVMLVYYPAAAFAKLNRDFLNPAYSCATTFAEPWARGFGLSAESMHSGLLGHAIVVSAAAIETIVGGCLLIRRMRWFGIVLGVCFHLALSLDNFRHFFDYTAVVLLGLTMVGGAHLLDRLNTVAQHRYGRLVLALTAVGGAALFVFGATRPNSSDPRALGPHYGNDWLYVGRFAWWFMIGIPWACVAVHWAWTQRRQPQPRVILASGPVLIALTLTVACAAGPYLGYRNQAVFNMYSNLIMENGRSNHLLMPAPLGLGPAPGSWIVTSTPLHHITVFAPPTSSEHKGCSFS